MRTLHLSAAVLIIATVLSTIALAQFTPAPATSPAKPAAPPMPLQPTPVDYAKIQSAALGTKLTISQRLARPADLLQQLELRSGVRLARPKSLGQNQSFSLDAKSLTVREILEKLAAQCKFDIDFRPELVLLTQKADDKLLADLDKQLASPDRWERATALWKLGQLSDPRIYPLLVKGLSDRDEGVIEWALKAIEPHSQLGFLLTDADKESVALAITHWFKNVENADAPITARLFGYGQPYGIGAWHMPPTGKCPRLMNARLDLLASMERRDGIKLLTDALASAKSMQVRGAAATALGESRLGAAELLQAIARLDADAAELQAIVDKAQKEAQEQKKPLMIQGELQQTWQKIAEISSAKISAFLALLKMHNPEAIAQALLWIKGEAPARRFTMYGPALIAEFSYEFDLAFLVKRELARFPALLDLKEKPQPPAAGVGGFGAGGMPAYNASSAVRTLAGLTDPAITPELLKLAKSDTAFSALASVNEYDPTFIFPIDDPEMLAALLARIKTWGLDAKLAMRSLGQSHDPKVADALVEKLKDPDPECAASAAKALAQTHDPRALDLLVALVKEKRNWPDPEAEDLAALQAGKAVRSRINPRRAIVFAIEDTRDPRAFSQLAALAQDKSLDPQTLLTARWCLRSAATTTQDMDDLAKLIAGSDRPAQLEILAHIATPPGGMWMWQMGATREPSPRCIADPRFIDYLASRALDDEAWFIRRNKKQRNYVVDALATMKTPMALKALVDRCNPDLGEDLPRLARVAIEPYDDPTATDLSLK